MKCEVKLNGDMGTGQLWLNGLGIYGLMVGHLWLNGLGIYGLNGWDSYGLMGWAFMA